MERVRTKKRAILRAVNAVVLSLGAAVVVFSTTGARTNASQDNKFIGASKCKACHDGAEKGNQFTAWESNPHSKAFETLASDAAKKVAADLGIADPQKSDKCLKCHSTAFGVDAKQIKKGFEPTAGVQCESCHGPGDEHVKARFKAAAAGNADAKAEAGEIVGHVPQSVCVQCHNSESPTFKPFCYYQRVETVRHMAPRSDEERGKELVCGCGEGCPENCDKCGEGCPDDGCAVPRSSLGK